MPSKKNKIQSNKLLFHPAIITIIGIVIIVLISIPLTKNISQKYKVNEKITSLEKEIKEIENQNLNLNGMVSYFESESFTEEQARLNFGLKKEGEDVLVIQDAETKDTKELKENIHTNRLNPKSNTQKWLMYYFKK